MHATDSNQAASRMRRLGRGMILSLISLSLALLACEVAIRAWIPVRSVGPSFTCYDSILGKRLKPKLSARRITPEFTMIIHTNSLGWRGPEISARPAGSVLCLGDSFTLGYGVDDGQEFPRLLAVHLDEALGERAPAVVNLGIGGNGNGRWLRLIDSEEVASFAPCLVLLQVCSNDWDDNASEGLYTMQPGAGPVALEVPPARWPRRIQAVIESLPGVDRTWMIGALRDAFAHESGAQFPPSRDAAPKIGGDLTQALIEESIMSCRARGWPVVLVSADLEGARLDELRHLAERLGTPFLACPSRNQRPDLYYRVDSHWNQQGHEHAAALLAEQLLASESLLGRRAGERH